MELTNRLATIDDIAVLEPLIESSIDVNLRGFLDDDQIRSSHAIMGIDRQLIDDGTYFVVEARRPDRRLRRLESPRDPLRRRPLRGP